MRLSARSAIVEGMTTATLSQRPVDAEVATVEVDNPLALDTGGHMHPKDAVVIRSDKEQRAT